MNMYTYIYIIYFIYIHVFYIYSVHVLCCAWRVGKATDFCIGLLMYLYSNMFPVMNGFLSAKLSWPFTFSSL